MNAPTNLLSRRLVATALALSLAAPAVAQQAKTEDHAVHHAPAASAAPAAAEVADGEVRRIDRDAGKLTLRHGEIKHLDMPAMTMVFTVRDKALLDRVQPGDKVRFRAVKEGSVYTVTEIEAQR